MYQNVGAEIPDTKYIESIGRDMGAEVYDLNKDVFFDHINKLFCSGVNINDPTICVHYLRKLHSLKTKHSCQNTWPQEH